MKKDIGKIIREKRNVLGLTQEDLAKKLYVTRQTISNWEQNKIKPDYEYIIKLSQILNISINELEYSEFQENKINLNKTRKRIKLLLKICIPIIILLIIIIVILFYLIRNNNYIEVYVGNIETTNIEMSNSIFVKTNERISLYLGSIINNNDNNKYKINIFYQNENLEMKSVYSGNYTDNIILEETIGYEEFFPSSFDINELYIEFIDINNDKSVYHKMNFKKENRKLKLFYDKKIGATDFSNKNNDLKIKKDLLIKNGYKMQLYDSNTYEKFGEINFFYNIALNQLSCHFDKSTITYYDNYKIVVVESYDKEKRDYNYNFTYNLENDEVSFTKGYFENYKKYINIILDEYNQITSANIN